MSDKKIADTRSVRILRAWTIHSSNTTVKRTANSTKKSKDCLLLREESEKPKEKLWDGKNLLMLKQMIRQNLN